MFFIFASERKKIRQITVLYLQEKTENKNKPARKFSKIQNSNSLIIKKIK
jgi:hypothetical protein